MKTFLNLCCAASVVCLLSFAANNRLKPDGSVARSSASPDTNAVFNSHARSKVVQYFETYQNDPVPTSAIRSRGVPAEIATGEIIQESDRSALLEVPGELARILPAHDPNKVRYFLAGSNLVAVTPNFKILDLVRIPAVDFPDGGQAQWVSHVRFSPEKSPVRK